MKKDRPDRSPFLRVAVPALVLLGMGSLAAANHSAPPSMHIQSCNLGCSGGSGGTQVSCGIVSIAMNQTLRIQFTHPVDPASLNGLSFNITNVSNGQQPTGTRSVDPSSPDTVVFEPSLSFDAFGNPIFGFEANATYRITIPGASQGDSPPFITSIDLPNLPNRSRMLCTVFVTQRMLSPGDPFCAGDGVDPVVTTPCPCANPGGTGRGCANSVAGSQGARLYSLGSVSPDSVDLYAISMPSPAVAVILQGDQSVPSGFAFGDGIRCASGNLLRLAVLNAPNGVSSYPNGGQPTITERSAQLGDPIAPGDLRDYQVWYRDSDAAFCPRPAGGDWNVTNAVRIAW
jgi:hypothetical protein